MSNTNRTAVSWLIDQINSRKCWADPNQLEPIIEQAKQMEKEQIITAFVDGHEYGTDQIMINANYHYTQTYHAFKGELIQDEIGNLKPKKNEQ